MLLVLALCQDVFERADREFRPFSATLRVERARGDASAAVEGRLEVTADRELRLEGRGLRAEELPGLDVWRGPWNRLRAEYAWEAERPSEPEGSPRPPVKVRLRPGPANAAGEAAERAVWVLTPKAGGPKLKVWFDVATLRAERVAWTTRSGAVAVTLGGGAGWTLGVDSEERR